jgi:hypothetical protein
MVLIGLCGSRTVASFDEKNQMESMLRVWRVLCMCCAVVLASRRSGILTISLADQLFQLKFTSKQLVRQSKKCEKNEVVQKLKLKQVRVVLLVCERVLTLCRR